MDRDATGPTDNEAIRTALNLLSITISGDAPRLLATHQTWVDNSQLLSSLIPKGTRGGCPSLTVADGQNWAQIWGWDDYLGCSPGENTEKRSFFEKLNDFHSELSQWPPARFGCSEMFLMAARRDLTIGRVHTGWELRHPTPNSSHNRRFFGIMWWLSFPTWSAPTGAGGVILCTKRMQHALECSTYQDFALSKNTVRKCMVSTCTPNTCLDIGVEQLVIENSVYANQRFSQKRTFFLYFLQLRLLSTSDLGSTVTHRKNIFRGRWHYKNITGYHSFGLCFFVIPDFEKSLRTESTFVRLPFINSWAVSQVLKSWPVGCLSSFWMFWNTQKQCYQFCARKHCHK